MTRRGAPLPRRSPEPAPAKAGAGFRFGAVRSWTPRSGVLLAGALVAGAVLSAALPAAPPSPPAPIYRDAPPPGYSGGFGEESCHACHSFEDLNDDAGRLTMEGVPSTYAPGEAYRLTLTLTRPGMVVGGFQLTGRFEDGGAQAGSLAPAPEEEDRLAITHEGGVDYAHHVGHGTSPPVADTARWVLLWTAPSTPDAGSGTVLFHAAANAGNEDDSPFGDFVYTAEAATSGSTRR